MKKATLILMIISVISKLFGLFRDITLSYFYGASNISDAFLISITIPMVIFSFIGAGINAGYIPMFSKIVKDHGRESAYRFTNNLVNTLIIICSLIILFALMFTTPIVKAFASGFEGETLWTAVVFTRISLFSIYAIALVYVFKGLLEVNNNFIIPSLIGFPMNLITVIAIIVSFYTKSTVLAIGSTIGMMSQLLLLIPLSKKYGYKYKPILDRKDVHLRQLMMTSLPVIIGVSLNEINFLVDRTIASRISIGGISALNYSNKLNGFVQGIFVLSIVTVLFPKISKLAIEKDYKQLKASVSEAVIGIILLLIPATIGSMIFATEVVQLLFGRGAFDSQATHLTASALWFYSIGMVGIGLRQILSRTFYSLHDTKTPMINGSIGVMLNIILNIILSRYLGIGGLALATSIAASFTTITLFISLRKKIGPFGMKRVSISFLKILFASSIMGVFAKLSFKYFTGTLSQNVSLAIAIGVGAVSYFIMIYFMKIDDVDVIISAVKMKLGRGKV